MDWAKNSRFFAAVGALVFAGGWLAWLSYGQYSAYDSASLALRRADASVAGMLAGTPLDAGSAPVSLTEDNVAAA